MTKAQAKKRIQQLREVLDDHRYRYHVLDDPKMSDAAYDSLMHELSKLEEQFPDLITKNSPTQRVGGKPLPEFAQVQHSTRMLSLQDVFDEAELISWETRNQKIIPGVYEYFVELKIDGVAVALIYQDGELLRAATRGDGVVGEDVTHNIRTINAIPLMLRGNVPGTVEVRGEVYMLKKDFEKMNTLRQAQGKPLFANPRNVSAGSIRQLDPSMAASRPLRFFAWEITRGVGVKTREEEYEKLIDLGFPVPPRAKLVPNITNVAKYAKRVEVHRERHPFQVDGLVVKLNDLSVSSRLGIVGKAPRGSIAYKFTAQEATTVVENIVVQVGRTGALTPVAHLKPVQVAGTTVSRATLHNADEIQRKDVRVGDTVIIHKAGDIIPEVKSVLIKLRPKKSKPFRFPKKCPVCGSPIEREKGEVVIRCTNPNCFSQQRERILHAVGRGGFDIEGLGEKIVEQLLQEGLIEEVPDLWELTEGDLVPLERFAETSARNLVQEIQARKHISLSRFLVALGIPQVGVVTAQDLAREFKTLDAVTAASFAQLVAVEGIGETVAQDIVDYFAQRHTQQLLLRYREVGIVLKKEKSGGKLAGKTFVFTGAMEGMTRDEAKQRVQALGGRIASTVGREVDYVVMGEEAGSKAKKAKKLGVTMITPAQFRKMIDN